MNVIKVKLIFNLKKYFYFSTVFVLFTVIGTISHEYGHILVAKFVGFDTELHFSSMTYNVSQLNEEIDSIYQRNEEALDNGLDFEDKEEYLAAHKRRIKNILVISLGGPLQTILTGLLGLLIILWRRKFIKNQRLKVFDWLAVFLSLFWLREVFNLVISIGSELLSPDGKYFGGDERKISSLLGIWPGSLSVILGLIGLAISLYIVFWVVPKKMQLTFILSGIIGGTLGFYSWMYCIGPILIP